jgi:hypothetical protein
MASNLPAHLKNALDHLAASAQAVERRPVDVLHTSWAELEKSVIKILGGAFDLEKPEHQAVALGLAASLGERFAESDKAFWFPNRESPEAAMLGFPEAILMISPFGAVLDALTQAKLPLLDAVGEDVRKSLAEAKFSLASAGPGAPRLGPEDYRRLFDAGFIQLLRVDPQKLKALFDARPAALMRDFREALAKTGKELPQDAREQFEQQVVSSLQRLKLDQPLSAQVATSPRLMELLIHLFATVGATGAAPEEFWHDVVMPLLFIGAPAQFPPLDEEEMKLVSEGVEPLALFLDAVPYQQASLEDGLLGVFEPKDVSLPHDDLGRGNVPPRLLQTKTGAIASLVSGFDPKKSQEALAGFSAYLGGKAGKPMVTSAPAQQMFEAALTLLQDLKRVVDDAAKEGSGLCLRRITEAEASSEPALMMVRKAIQGPRIILAP